MSVHDSYDEVWAYIFLTGVLQVLYLTKPIGLWTWIQSLVDRMFHQGRLSQRRRLAQDPGSCNFCRQAHLPEISTLNFDSDTERWTVAERSSDAAGIFKSPCMAFQSFNFSFFSPPSICSPPSRFSSSFPLFNHCSRTVVIYGPQCPSSPSSFPLFNHCSRTVVIYGPQCLSIQLAFSSRSPRQKSPCHLSPSVLRVLSSFFPQYFLPLL